MLSSLPTLLPRSCSLLMPIPTRRTISFIHLVRMMKKDVTSFGLMELAAFWLTQWDTALASLFAKMSSDCTHLEYSTCTSGGRFNSGHAAMCQLTHVKTAYKQDHASYSLVVQAANGQWHHHLCQLHQQLCPSIRIWFRKQSRQAFPNPRIWMFCNTHFFFSFPAQIFTIWCLSLFLQYIIII